MLVMTMSWRDSCHMLQTSFFVSPCTSLGAFVWGRKMMFSFSIIIRVVYYVFAVGSVLKALFAWT
jgi:hypothetical protein